MFVVYSTESCPYCDRAKALLDRMSLEYEVVDLNDDEAARTMFRERAFRTVPQIFVTDDEGNPAQHIGGYDDLVVHLRDN